ncbi:hypothetical protein [Dawidia soli]|uniref:Uncharacterized protein n=1 Tax=Dawidia soli TaxID=2782352 RepID=A0AAP2DEE5_9BACT|nr:hypothetical protein [Dawidia soli]MBT1689762.1 hypothetical protein [Dawidia soli]
MLFATSAVSPVVRQEILIASQKFKDPSRVVVIYDRKVGKDSLPPALCTEVYIDLTADPRVIIEKIASSLTMPAQKKGKNLFTELGGILLAGLGLFKLARLSYYPGFAEEQLSMVHEDSPQYVQYVVKRPEKRSTPQSTTSSKKSRAVKVVKKRSNRK